MKFHILYHGFAMRRNTEHIRHSEGAQKFFEDHGIPYTIELIGGKDCIVYHEANDKVHVPITHLHDLDAYTKLYGLRFIFEADALPAIDFK